MPSIAIVRALVLLLIAPLPLAAQPPNLHAEPGANGSVAGASAQPNTRATQPNLSPQGQPVGGGGPPPIASPDGDSSVAPSPTHTTQLSPSGDAPQLTAPRTGAAGSATRLTGTARTVAPVLGSLALVLGVFFAVVWIVRRGAPSGSQTLPKEVVEVLGRTPLAGRQSVHLLRLGRKLVLVNVSATGAETLTEITDPLEVDRLAGLCQQTQPHSATAAFRNVFDQFANDRGEGDPHRTKDDESLPQLHGLGYAPKGIAERADG